MKGPVNLMGNDNYELSNKLALSQILFHNDFYIPRAMYPRYMIYFHCQQKDSEEEVEEIIRNILQLQGKVTMLRGKMLQIS